MSLFKILKGEQNNLKVNEAATIHEGWAYFTEDKGNFYIDTKDSRVQINPKSKSYRLDIASDGWSPDKQPNGYYLASTEIEELLDLYNGTLGFPQGLTEQEIANMIYYQIKIGDILPGTNPGFTKIKIEAHRKPTAPISLILTLQPKEGAIIKGPTGV